MSDVQTAVLEKLNANEDYLVRAKTGTGKTLAFMIAALERVLQDKTAFGNNSIPILVLAPTRELALQIAAESKKLVKHHRLRVVTAVGGTPRNQNLIDIVRRRCDILVGTPGRLNDLFQAEKAVRDKIDGIKVVVFDEADQLLEMGFQKEIQEIVSFLPRQRSTFMFSATLSPEIRKIAKATLNPNYTDIDTVPKNQVETHMKIKQSFMISPYADHLYLLQSIIKKHKETEDSPKILIFCPITNMVVYLSKVLNSLPGFETLEIHAKLTQNQRMRVSEQFRQARSAIMCTTDVSARGVDYPGVTLVIQLGMPSSREQYIHRIGRTGRADKSGEALLILSPYEKRFLERIDDLPIRKELRYILPQHARDADVESTIEKSIAIISSSEKNSNFMSLLGFRSIYLTRYFKTPSIKDS